jgi:hypothetical protein
MAHGGEVKGVISRTCVSPEDRACIDTFPKFWRFLQGVCQELFQKIDVSQASETPAHYWGTQKDNR